MAIKYPSIPDPTTDPENLRQCVAAIKETIESYTNQRLPDATATHSGVTWQNLVDLGLVTSQLTKLAGNQQFSGLVTWQDLANLVLVTAPGVALANFTYVYRTANQVTIANGVLTKVQFNIEGSDLDGVYDNATNFRYQPKVAGKYVVLHAIRFVGLPAGVLSSTIYKNGVQSFDAGVYGGSAAVAGGAIIDMNGSTDYLELFVFQNSGGNVDLQGGQNQNWLTARRIGA